MKRALLRLEDVGPGGIYSTQENLIKLRAIADYLKSENFPFHISVIPRYIDPPAGYDKSIADTTDSYIISFNDTLKYMVANGGLLGMHGYTHQYANSVSGVGHEFFYNGCLRDCPPNDPPDACTDRIAFVNSYASSRMRQGYNTYKVSGLKINWGYSTPHYTAPQVQRCILEAWSGIFFENDPQDPTKRTLTIRDTDSTFYRGVVYVPTPLGYVRGSPYSNADVDRICQEIPTYTSQDVAAFFYHPYLEFSFIHITETGIVYDDNSYLKRLINCFKQYGFTFVQMISLVNFVPGSRHTNHFAGIENIFFTGKTKAYNSTSLIIWQPLTGTWYYIFCNLIDFPDRQNESDVFVDVLALSSWAVGNYWKPLLGDFNGDGNDDIAVWLPATGDWQVALSDGMHFIPTRSQGGSYSWLKPWAKGSYWVPFVGDFNGDGKDDIMVWNPQDGDWQVALSSGSQFVPARAQGGSYSWLIPWAVGSNWQPLIGDFNGDRISDIVVADVTQGDWRVALSMGDRFDPVGSPFRPWAAASDMQPFAGDFNSCGKAEILARHLLLRNGTVDVAVSVIQ